MSYHLRKKKCGNWRQGDKDLPKVFLLESHKGGDRTLFPFFSFNAFFSTLYSGTPVPPLSTGLPKVVNQMTYINANQCLPCFNTCRNFKCWDHTPPGGNLPKLQVPLGIGDLSLVFLCFYWLLFLLFFCGFLFFCLFCKYQCFFVSLGFFFYTLSLVLVEFIYSWASNTVYMLMTLKSSSPTRISLSSPSQGHHTHLDSVGPALPWEVNLIVVHAIGTHWYAGELL